VSHHDETSFVWEKVCYYLFCGNVYLIFSNTIVFVVYNCCVNCLLMLSALFDGVSTVNINFSNLPINLLAIELFMMMLCMLVCSQLHSYSS